MKYQISEAVQVLERTPGVLHAMLHGLSDTWLLATEGEGTWSPRDIVAHLVGMERAAWIPRVRHVLEHGEARPFEPMDRTAEIVASAGKPIDRLLQDFAELRRENLDHLAVMRLTDAQLELTTKHPDFGAVQLRNLLATWVAHDLSHTSQIVRVMATQYRDEVGPWRQLLRVIR